MNSENLYGELKEFLSKNQTSMLLFNAMEIRFSFFIDFTQYSIEKEKELYSFHWAIYLLKSLSELSIKWDLHKSKTNKIKKRIFDYCSNLNNNNTPINFIEKKRELIKKIYLAIYTTFTQKEKIGALKREKLTLLFISDELRQKGIEILERNKEKLENYLQIPPIQNPELFLYARNKYGPYERTLDIYAESSLVDQGLLVRVKRGNTDLFEITPDGQEFTENLLNTDIQFQEIKQIALVLKTYFDDMGGKELEAFIKTKVYPEWDQIQKGEYYHDFKF